MAAGVRIVMTSFQPGGVTPEKYDTTTYASVAAAVSGVANGFLQIVTEDTAETVGLSVAQIKSIIDATF